MVVRGGEGTIMAQSPTHTLKYSWKPEFATRINLSTAEYQALLDRLSRMEDWLGKWEILNVNLERAVRLVGVVEDLVDGEQRRGKMGFLRRMWWLMTGRVK